VPAQRALAAPDPVRRFAQDPSHVSRIPSGVSNFSLYVS
jgi:hypothetical protein